MDPISVGLIGVGGFGAAHLSQLELLEKEGILRLVAVSDFRSDNLAEVAAALERRGIRWHEHYASLLAEEDLETVIISTPIPLHKEMTLAALDRGLHVYLEKPPVPLLQDLEELIAADLQRRVAVGFISVTCPVVERIKRLAVAKEIGQLLHVRLAGLWPRQDRYYHRSSWAGKLQVEGKSVFDGPATNAMSHYLHALAFLAGEAFPEYGRLSHVTGELYRARPIESYDLACLSGEFENGIEFTAALGHPSSRHYEMTLRLTGTDQQLDIVFGRYGVSSSLGSGIFPGQDLLRQTMLDFTSSIRLGRNPRSMLSDCRPYVQMTNAMAISSGRIHDIPREYITYTGQGESTVCDVEGIHGAVQRTLESGELFSQQDLPWAMATTPRSISVIGLPSLDMEKLTPPLPVIS